MRIPSEEPRYSRLIRLSSFDTFGTIKCVRLIECRTMNRSLKLILHETALQFSQIKWSLGPAIPVGQNGLHVGTLFLSALFNNTVNKSNI